MNRVIKLSYLELWAIAMIVVWFVIGNGKMQRLGSLWRQRCCDVSMEIVGTLCWENGRTNIYILGDIIVQVNDMACLWVDTISLTENVYVIMYKDIKYLVNKFTHNISLVLSTCLWRKWRLRKLKPSTIPMVKFHSNLSYEGDQDARTTATHLCICLKFCLTKQAISSFLTTMWYHTGGCTK